MRLFETIVLFCVICVVSINAAIFMSLAAVHPDHPGKCWDSSNQVAYDVGTHHPKNTCLEILCSKAFSLTVHSCGLVLAPPGHHNEHDLTKPYPQCCVKIVKDAENREIEQEPLSVKSEPSADGKNQHP